MSKEDFDNINIREKIWMLYKQGTFVVGIRYYRYKINLYLLENYYVEAYYCPKDDRIERIDLLDPKSSRMKFYSDQISLEDLNV